MLERATDADIAEVRRRLDAFTAPSFDRGIVEKLIARLDAVGGEPVQAPAVRVKGLADKLKLAEYVMTKDSFCEAERLEEGLSVVRRIRSALEAETGGGDDWTVDDSLTAREILNYLGIGSDASLEPFADRRRDHVAKLIQKRVSVATTPDERAVEANAPPCWWIDHGSHGQITQREDEANSAIAEGKKVVRYLAQAATPTADERVVEAVTITYTNYRGATGRRTITPKRMWFGATEWHPVPQWLLTAYDHEKQADRDFALKDFGNPPTTADERVVEALIAIRDGLRSDGKIWLDNGNGGKEAGPNLNDFIATALAAQEQGR